MRFFISILMIMFAFGMQILSPAQLQARPTATVDIVNDVDVVNTMSIDNNSTEIVDCFTIENTYKYRGMYVLKPPLFKAHRFVKSFKNISAKYMRGDEADLLIAKFQKKGKHMYLQRE